MNPNCFMGMVMNEPALPKTPPKVESASSPESVEEVAAKVAEHNRLHPVVQTYVSQIPQQKN